MFQVSDLLEKAQKNLFKITEKLAEQVTSYRPSWLMPATAK